MTRLRDDGAWFQHRADPIWRDVSTEPVYQMPDQGMRAGMLPRRSFMARVFSGIGLALGSVAAGLVFAVGAGLLTRVVLLVLHGFLGTDSVPDEALVSDLAGVAAFWLGGALCVIGGAKSRRA